MSTSINDPNTFRLPQHFSPMPTPTLFIQVLISMNLYQHANNQVFSLFCSRDIFDLKMLWSDWSRAFWPISQEPEFTKYGICPSVQQLIYFHYRWNEKKIITRISYTFKRAKKPRLGLFFSFCGQKCYFQKIQLSCATPNRPLTPWWVPEKKLRSQFQDNFLIEGRTDLIHRILLGTIWGLIRQ